MKSQNVFAPPLSLLCKLASVAVHADELLSPGGHKFDAAALKVLLKDSEVSGWLQEMTKAGMAPVKRTK